MPQEPPPPIVTIRTPGRSDGPGDLLSSGSEKPAWQPSPRQRRVALLMAVLVTAIGAPAGVFVHLRRQHEANVRDLAAVRLATVDRAIAIATVQIPLTLVNESPQPLTLLWARVERAGYGRQNLARTVLQPSTDTDLFVDVDRGCQGATPTSGPAAVLVRVRTALGNEQTLRLGTGDSRFATAYETAQVAYCYIEAVSTALVFEQAPPQRGDVDLVVRYTVRNTLPDPVTVLAAHPADGLSLGVLGVPVRLDGGARSTMTVRLRVTDCAKALVGYPTSEPGPQDVVPPVYVNTEGRHTSTHQTPLVGTDLALALGALVHGSCGG